MNENQAPKLETINEIKDGRKDIYLSFTDKDGNPKVFAVLTEELVNNYALDYEKIKDDPEELGRVLIGLGTGMINFSRKGPPLPDLNFMLESYPEAIELIDYFIRRCEGKEVPEGHGQIISKKAYGKFKSFWDKYFTEGSQNGN